MTATATGATGRVKARKESLEEVLRRRSAPSAGPGTARAAAARLSLDALTRNAEGALRDVPLEALQPSPFQPRFQFQRQPLEELAQSLASEGQLEPAIARRLQREGQETLEIVAGARRLEAAKICNATIRPFPTLRVDVRELTDEEAERIGLIENLQREDLTPLEEGYRYWQLQRRDPRRWSVRSIAEFVHKKKSTVQNRMGLVKDAAVAEAVLREQIPPTAGFHVLRLPAAEREAYLRAAVAQRRTVEQIKGDVERRLSAGQPARHVSLDGDAGVAVRGHVRRRPGSAPATAAEHEAARQRREQLQSERARLLERMESLETELHRCQSALRGIDRELAALPGGAGALPGGAGALPGGAGALAVQQLDGQGR